MLSAFTGVPESKPLELMVSPFPVESEFELIDQEAGPLATTPCI
jgi:hypothetical protein